MRARVGASATPGHIVRVIGFVVGVLRCNRELLEQFITLARSQCADEGFDIHEVGTAFLNRGFYHTS